MFCSLNEIQSLAVKATRGAGLSWGIADDAGWAVRWLEFHGVSGLACLDHALSSLEGRKWTDSFPVPEGECWRAREGEMDGLLAGITVADRAWADLERAPVDPTAPVDSTARRLQKTLQPGTNDGRLELKEVRGPVLMIPFLANFSYFTCLKMQVSCAALRKPVRIADGVVSGNCRELADIPLAHSLEVQHLPSAATPRRLRHLHGSIPVDDEVYSRLMPLAHKTYVPESAESQTHGAGGADLIEID